MFPEKRVKERKERRTEGRRIKRQEERKQATIRKALEEPEDIAPVKPPLSPVVLPVNSITDPLKVAGGIEDGVSPPLDGQVAKGAFKPQANVWVPKSQPTKINPEAEAWSPAPKTRRSAVDEFVRRLRSWGIAARAAET